MSASSSLSTVFFFLLFIRRFYCFVLFFFFFTFCPFSFTFVFCCVQKATHTHISRRTCVICIVVINFDMKWCISYSRLWNFTIVVFAFIILVFFFYLPLSLFLFRSFFLGMQTTHFWMLFLCVCVCLWKKKVFINICM